ncbi:hypothetical protein [Microbulbifer epialgicus]|uniref:Uncharacterized protein n=1 Tax=Microbulbifer epialgicus TaxID=393907 RepID=A0ABV4NTQ9_9GAMM
MLSWILTRIKTAQEGDRLSSDSIDSAISEIEKHGMKAHFYLAGLGNRENKELSYALDTLVAAGFIITDSQGSLVGGVATKNLSSEELIQQRRATFKIVK